VAEIPGIQVIYNGSTRVFGEPGRDLMLFDGVLYPDTGLTPGDLLEMLRQQHPTARWHQIKGRYAGAYIRASTREIVAFNDHIGLRDLYLWQDGDDCAVGDDFALLIQHIPNHARTLDGEAAAAFLSLGFTVNNRTFAAGVRRLPPGSHTTVSGSRAEQETVWRYELRPVSGQMGDAVDHCWSRLTCAAERIYMLTAPSCQGLLGLSGGLDSRLTAKVCKEAGIRVRPYFFGECESEAALVASAAAKTLGLSLSFAGRCREFPQYFSRSMIVNPMANLEWCKYLSGRDTLDSEADAILSGHLGDRLLGDWGLRLNGGPDDNREIARQLFHGCALEKVDAETAERIIADVSRQLDSIGGPIVQRKQGFWFHNVNMFVKHCGLFQSIVGQLPHYSPFEDVDVVDAALELPASWRLRNRFYRQLFAKYIPELLPDRVPLDGGHNTHKPLERWLYRNSEFARQVGAIMAGHASRNDIHRFFRRLTVHAYRSRYE
jgi:hypothetical protein